LPKALEKFSDTRFDRHPLLLDVLEHSVFCLFHEKVHREVGADLFPVEPSDVLEGPADRLQVDLEGDIVADLFFHRAGVLEEEPFGVEEQSVHVKNYRAELHSLPAHCKLVGELLGSKSHGSIFSQQGGM